MKAMIRNEELVSLSYSILVGPLSVSHTIITFPWHFFHLVSKLSDIIYIWFLFLMWNALLYSEWSILSFLLNSNFLLSDGTNSIDSLKRAALYNQLRSISKFLSIFRHLPSLYNRADARARLANEIYIHLSYYQIKYINYIISDWTRKWCRLASFLQTTTTDYNQRVLCAFLEYFSYESLLHKNWLADFVRKWNVSLFISFI